MKQSLLLKACCAAIFGFAAAAGAAHAKPDIILHSFAVNGSDGVFPRGGLMIDAKGNLYGTTLYGGTNNYGTVFEISHDGTETVLHSFANDGADGVYPVGGVIMDKKGNLYGTANAGGQYGYGAVFKLTPAGAETILHSFTNDGVDGVFPYSPLAIDKRGNLYGTTANGGQYTYGTVFKVSRKGAETVLHAFAADGKDGLTPYFGVTLDKQGNLYGMTQQGGQYGRGMVFKLAKDGTETLLHPFNNDGVDGVYPLGGLTIDKTGNLYGAAGGCPSGYSNCGVIFKLSPSGAETILFTFPSDGSKGGLAMGMLVADKKGNLYGTAEEGGQNCAGAGCGVVFKLTPTGNETLLHSFSIDGRDGYFPDYGVIMDSKGNLYGTTQSGGQYAYGTVFEVKN